jgi:hypothetical protein
MYVDMYCSQASGACTWAHSILKNRDNAFLKLNIQTMHIKSLSTTMLSLKPVYPGEIRTQICYFLRWMRSHNQGM